MLVREAGSRSPFLSGPRILKSEESSTIKRDMEQQVAGMLRSGQEVHAGAVNKEDERFTETAAQVRTNMLR